MAPDVAEGPARGGPPRGGAAQPGGSSWRRVALLILAITIHNIPGESPPRVPLGALERGLGSCGAALLRWSPGSLAPGTI